MSTCRWISCATWVDPIVPGGPTPAFCGPLCRTLEAGYVRYLDGGGDDTTDVVLAGVEVQVDARQVADRARHLKALAAAHQEALW